MAVVPDQRFCFRGFTTTAQMPPRDIRARAAQRAVWLSSPVRGVTADPLLEDVVPVVGVLPVVGGVPVVGVFPLGIVLEGLSDGP